MKRAHRFLAPLLLASAAAACNEVFDIESPTLVPEASDASNDASNNSPESDGSIDSTVPAFDATTPIDGGPDGIAPPQVLITYNQTAVDGGKTEVVSFDLQTLAIAGRYEGPGFIGTTYVDQLPFLLQQEDDLVLLLNRSNPTATPLSFWNVAGGDGGYSYTDPGAVVVVGTKAYVLRYNRNDVMVLDLGAGGTAASPALPTKKVSLAQFHDPNDSDGIVEPAAAYYDPGSKLLYVVIGNIDENHNTPCTTTSEIIAIDTTNDTIHPLPGGTGPGGGVALIGSNPPLGVKVIARPADNKLFVLTAGCYGNGVLARAEVDSVSLDQFVVTTAVNIVGIGGYAQQFALINETTAAIGLYAGPTYPWAINGNTLGPPMPGAPEFFAADGKGNLVGTRTVSVDGGSATQVVRFPIEGDAGATVLGTSVENITPAIVANVDVWPGAQIP